MIDSQLMAFFARLPANPHASLPVRRPAAVHLRVVAPEPALEPDHDAHVHAFWAHQRIMLLEELAKRAAWRARKLERASQLVYMPGSKRREHDLLLTACPVKRRPGRKQGQQYSRRTFGRGMAR